MERFLLLPKRHRLHLIRQTPPIVRMQLGVLDQLLAPVLVQATDVVLGALEESELMQETFLDEDAASVLGDNGLFVLI